MTQIISYKQIEDIEEFHPQNRMNFQTKSKNYSIVLMSVQEKSNNRIIHIFKLILTSEKIEDFQDENNNLPDNDRVIPGHVQREVYERDKGQCVKCGSKDHLHLDHVYPFAKGGPQKI